MISIIIVNYNSGLFLKRCLQSIQTNIKILYEVIVVDNHSNDDSVEKCIPFFDNDNFTLIKLENNLGFAKANNIGYTKSSGDIIHFLNPDTELPENMNLDYQLCIKDPSFIYVNKLQNLDGTFVESKNTIPTLYNCWKKVFSSSNVFFWYTGATIIISRNNFIKIGMWNEVYFMYSEDLDLFYKASRLGIHTKQLPANITHVGGGSSSNVWNSFERELMVQKSFKLFFIANNIKWQYPFLLGLLFLRYLRVKPRHALLLLRVWIKINC